MPSVCVLDPFKCRKCTNLRANVQFQLYSNTKLYDVLLLYIRLIIFDIYLLFIYYINIIIVQLIPYYYLISYRNYLIKVIVVFINLFSLLYSTLFPILLNEFHIKFDSYHNYLIKVIIIPINSFNFIKFYFQDQIIFYWSSWFFNCGPVDKMLTFDITLTYLHSLQFLFATPSGSEPQWTCSHSSL